MTSLQQQIALIGLAFGLGLVLLIRYVLPSQPNLRAAIRRQTDPTADDTPAVIVDPDKRIGLGTQVGIRLYPTLAHRSWMKIPYKDLAILRQSVPEYIGNKVGTVLICLFWPPILNALLTFTPSGSYNWSVPIIASLGLAAAGWFLPDISVRQRATAARDNFARHLGAFIEMVAIVRANGAGTADALHKAAVQGDSWVFLRLQEELSKADTSHRAPWDALRTLADEVDAPDLSDLADQLVLTGQGVSVADSMRETAKSLRNKNLSKEQADATSATKRLRVPLGLLALLFVLLIMYPAGAAMMGA